MEALSRIDFSQKDFDVSTTITKTQFVIEIEELGEGSYLTESVEVQRARYRKFLSFYADLQTHVSSLEIENRLGLRVAYKLPAPYDKVFQYLF